MVVRDFNRDVSSRASLFLLKAFNSALYYEPVYELIKYGYELGFGNSHFEYLYQQISENSAYRDVLMPGPLNWCEYDSQQVQGILHAHSLCERIKIEVNVVLNKTICVKVILESILPLFTNAESNPII